MKALAAVGDADAVDVAFEVPLPCILVCVAHYHGLVAECQSGAYLIIAATTCDWFSRIF